MKNLTNRIIANLENCVPHAYRYKSFDINENSKQLYWITQETYDVHQKIDCAELLAEQLHKLGFYGWDVNVEVRDDYCGIDNTAWITQQS